MTTKTDTATPATPGSPLVEDVRVAMRKAFNFGQTYWRQSDSDSAAQNRASDETATKFRQLVTDTCTALAAGIAQPAVPQDGLMADQREEFIRQVVSGVAEMDRDSPEDQPEMMLVTPEELRGCIESAFEHMDEEADLAAIPAPQAPASTLTQSRDRDPWTEEQRVNHRKNKALTYRCTICCARSGEPHLPSCSEGQGICGA